MQRGRHAVVLVFLRVLKSGGARRRLGVGRSALEVLLVAEHSSCAGTRFVLMNRQLKKDVKPDLERSAWSPKTTRF